MGLDSLFVFMTHPERWTVTNLLIFLIGLLIPILIGIILPRKKTIGYGRIIYRLLGTCLGQTRIQQVPTGIIQSIMAVIRSTFVDLSFGVYIESRTDLSETDRDKKVEEYLNLTVSKPPQPEDPSD